MAIGQSGGRSARNKKSAPRRATQRERAAIDPPGRSDWEKAKIADEEDRWVLTVRGERLANFFAWTCWLIFCTMFAIVICAWWGLV